MQKVPSGSNVFYQQQQQPAYVMGSPSMGGTQGMNHHHPSSPMMYYNNMQQPPSNLVFEEKGMMTSNGPQQQLVHPMHHHQQNMMAGMMMRTSSPLYESYNVQHQQQQQPGQIHHHHNTNGHQQMMEHRSASSSSPTSFDSSSGSSSGNSNSTPTINTKVTKNATSLTPTINTSNLKRSTPNQSRSAITPNNNYSQQQQNRRRNDNTNANRANSVSSPTQLSITNDAAKRTLQLRTQYLTFCDMYSVKPSQEVIRLLKSAIRNQEPLVKMSICHAQADDDHVKALVHALTAVVVSKGSNNRSKGVPSLAQSNTLFDVNEILLNHNKITDKGANLIIRELLLPTSPYYKQIISIELFGNELTDACCELVSEMLRTNKVLKRLKLGDNKIGPEGARLLGEGLKHNQTLTQLHLGGNNVDVIGIKSIANALINNTTLTSLGLRDNGVGSDGMKALAETLKSNTQLSDIQLKGNNIKAMGASFLSTALITNQSLKVLELQSNAIGPVGVKSLCQALKDNHSVHALNFNDNELGDEGALYVATLLKVNPSITTLGLANNRIRKKGAVALAEALKCEQTAVTGLDLGNNEIGNGGAVALSSALAVNKVLTSLDLRSCEIHLKGILALSQMSESNTTLRHLDLGANYAKNQGASSWANVLSKNKSLTRLCLTDNQIYHEGGEALAVGLQTNYTLRNFSYGGQGPQQNKIDSSIRRIIDSIVSENKKYWEQHQQSSDVTYSSNNQLRFIDISKMRLQQQMYYNRMGADESGQNPEDFADQENNSGDENVDHLLSPGDYSAVSPLFPQSPSIDGKSYNAMPNWLLSSLHIPRSNVEPEELDTKLEFIFKNKLLKAENPKFKGCYFIGNIVNTLKKVYPDTRIDEAQLVQFAVNNPKYHVHLSREMVKTQMKYVGDEVTSKQSSTSVDQPPTLTLQKRNSLRSIPTRKDTVPSSPTEEIKKTVRIDPSLSSPKVSTIDLDNSTSTGPATPPSPTLEINTRTHAPMNKRALTDSILSKQDSSSMFPTNINTLDGHSTMGGGLFSLYSPIHQSLFPSSSNNGARTMSPFLDNPNNFGQFNTVGGTAFTSGSFSMFGQQPATSVGTPTGQQPYTFNPQQVNATAVNTSHERQGSDDAYNRYDSMVDRLLQ